MFLRLPGTVVGVWIIKWTKTVAAASSFVGNFTFFVAGSILGVDSRGISLVHEFTLRWLSHNSLVPIVASNRTCFDCRHQNATETKSERVNGRKNGRRRRQIKSTLFPNAVRGLRADMDSYSLKNSFRTRGSVIRLGRNEKI